MLRYRFNKASTQHFIHRDYPFLVIADRGRPSVARAMAQALKGFQASMPVDAIAADISTGAVDHAADRPDYAGLRAGVGQAFGSIVDIVRRAGEQAGADINVALHHGRVRKDEADPFGFSLYGDDVTATTRAYQDALITALTSDARDQVSAIIAAGVSENLPPELIAERLRDVVGLTDRLATAVVNYRAALESGSAAALSRQLRDDTFDAEVRAAIRSGTALDPSRIDAMVEAYGQGALDYRANAIAGTESIRAANIGLRQSYRQAVSAGTFPDAAVRAHPTVHVDERTCPYCLAVAADQSNVAGTSVFSALMLGDEEIGDPPFHVSCRCFLQMRTNLDMLPNTGTTP